MVGLLKKIKAESLLFSNGYKAVAYGRQPFSVFSTISGSVVTRATAYGLSFTFIFERISDAQRLKKEFVGEEKGMATPELLLALGFATLLASNAIAHTGHIWFGYKGNAPANWGKLSPDYKTCSIGTHQSPINIAKDDIYLQNKLHDLRRQYVDANATIVNNGFNIMVRFIQNAGFMSQYGKNYRLEQLHWHTPSEHMLNMKKFPLEIHLVHKSDDGKIIVVAILYEYGNIDPFIYQLKDAIVELAEKSNSNNKQKKFTVSVGLVKTKAFKRHTRKFFKYMGSLTTPPCTENVTWYILGKVRKVSKDQIALIRSPLSKDFKKNARPIQPLNGRIVELYDESKFNSSST